MSFGKQSQSENFNFKNHNELESHEAPMQVLAHKTITKQYQEYDCFKLSPLTAAKSQS